MEVGQVPGAMRPIRELDNDEFFERFQCDRLTANVLGSRLRYVVQHMCTGLLQTAFSMIIRDWYDFAASVSGPRSLDYPMPAVSNSLMLFLGTMAEALRNSVEEFGVDRLQPGDVLVANDPYKIGNHPNDVCFIRPIFHGGSEPVAFVSLRAHLQDVGGVVPAGFSGTKRNVYENGLVMSPRLLYRDDEPVLETWNLLFDNARWAELLVSDINSVHGALQLGEKLIVETIDRYGLDAFHGAVRYACDLSYEAMANSIAELPDGVYQGEDLLDGDAVDDTEQYRVKVKVKVSGDRLEVDFSGTSRQARTSVNAGWLDTKTGVSIALMFLLAPTSAFTSGALRNVDIVLPDSTYISAAPPDGAIMLFFESVVTIVSAVFRALSLPLGEGAVGGDFGSLSLHNVSGVDAGGQPWASMAQLGGEHGPWAGTKDADGDSFMVFYPANNIDPATEAIESDIPVVVLRKEYVPDTAGPGLHRGGAAVVHDTLYFSGGEHYSMPLHFRNPSGFGVWGGGTGRAGGVWAWEGDGKAPGRNEVTPPALGPGAYVDAVPVAGVFDPETKEPDGDGEYFSFARVPTWSTDPGAMFRYITNGGGGWGAPLERDIDAVLADVRDEYFSAGAAREVFGVVVEGDPRADPEGLTVDRAASEELRRQMAAGS
jgi:N-methylhydantoinase B